MPRPFDGPRAVMRMVSESDSMGVYSKKELKEFRVLLEGLRARLRGDVQQLTDGALTKGDASGDSRSPTHIADVGTDNYEQDFALRFVENEQETLREISEALERIDAGSYGGCEKCLELGKTPSQARIKKPRLRAIPFTRCCIECERLRESETQ
jgi:DnaK suppressor protein